MTSYGKRKLQTGSGFYRDVCLKLLDEKLYVNDEERRFYESEPQILAQLEHEFIVKYIEEIFIDNYSINCLVMELAEDNLRNYIEVRSANLYKNKYGYSRNISLIRIIN
jgi:serine/threonine protein kinase